jgi:DNA repair exonuclease SbcCD ATPase subunit
MITFKTIKWKNLLSTGNVFTEVELNKESNVLILGENGAGKSTILDAITFALFGKPYRNINKPQLVNSVNGKDCLVELYFDIADRKYIIRRGIKPNIFEIYVDDSLLDQNSSAKEYQEVLEKSIIKMNYKSFTQIVILGSASFTPFMQLSANDRRQVIEDLLDIQIFSNMNQVVKEKVNGLKNKVNELKIKLESTKEKIELHKAHIESIKKNNQEIIDKKLEQLEENKTELEKLIATNEEEATKITELESEIQHQESMLKKQKLLTSYQAKIENNISKAEKEIEFYNDNDQCPSCKQEIEPEFKKQIIGECQDKMQNLVEGLTTLREEQRQVIENLEQIKKINDGIIELQKQINSNQTLIRHMQKYNITLQQEIEELESKKNTNVQSKEQSKKLLDELTTIVEERKKAVEEKQYYDAAAQLLKDGGIKAKIIKQYLPIINKLVNKYLAAMDFFVNFHMDEEFKETIKSRNRDDFSYENFSEGEKTRINLALLFTWRNVARMKNSANTNLLILDEVFDSSLDSFGVECLMQVLSSLDNINIFIISHKGDSLQDKFEHVIRFEKKGNFSHKRLAA